MTVRQSLTFIGCLLLAASATAGDDALPFADSSGCMEGPMAQFGRYLGDWKIEDMQRAQDGSWSAGKGARWVFSCLGNGAAIQDFWYPPNGKVGTNLRTYDPETGTWEIAWTISGMPGFAHIRAEKKASGNIIMQYVAPLPNPLRRITFFPPDDNGWNWKLEFSRDGGETWLEVYRIKATPFDDG